MSRDLLLLMQARAYRKSQWHSLLSALDGIDGETFSFVPSRHNGFPWMNGSIRDIVYHVTGDKLVQHSHAFGDRSVIWESLDGKPKESRETMMHELEAAHDALAMALSNQTDDGLKSKVQTWGGKTMSAQDFFLMLIEHDLYHAGQIRYIRNVIG